MSHFARECQSRFRDTGYELSFCEDQAKGSLPRSNIHEVDKGSWLGEAFEGRRDCQEGYGGAEAGSNPEKRCEEHGWEENPWGKRTNKEWIESFPESPTSTPCIHFSSYL